MPLKIFALSNVKNEDGLGRLKNQKMISLKFCIADFLILVSVISFYQRGFDINICIIFYFVPDKTAGHRGPQIRNGNTITTSELK